MTKRAAIGPFGTFCLYVVTKRAGSASNLTRFVTLMTKRAVVTKRAATAGSCRAERETVRGSLTSGGISPRNHGDALA